MADKTKTVTVEITSAIVWEGDIVRQGRQLPVPERDAKLLLERGKAKIAPGGEEAPAKKAPAKKAESDTDEKGGTAADA